MNDEPLGDAMVVTSTEMMVLGVDATATSLALPTNVSTEQAQELASRLSHGMNMTAWALTWWQADLLRWARDHPDVGVSQVTDWLEMARGTAANRMLLARIPPELRRRDVSPSVSVIASRYWNQTDQLRALLAMAAGIDIRDAIYEHEGDCWVSAETGEILEPRGAVWTVEDMQAHVDMLIGAEAVTDAGPVQPNGKLHPTPGDIDAELDALRELPGQATLAYVIETMIDPEGIQPVDVGGLSREVCRWFIDDAPDELIAWALRRRGRDE